MYAWQAWFAMVSFVISFKRCGILFPRIVCFFCVYTFFSLLQYMNDIVYLLGTYKLHLFCNDFFFLIYSKNIAFIM